MQRRTHRRNKSTRRSKARGGRQATPEHILGGYNSDNRHYFAEKACGSRRSKARRSKARRGGFAKFNPAWV